MSATQLVMRRVLWVLVWSAAFGFAVGSGLAMAWLGVYWAFLLFVVAAVTFGSLLVESWMELP